MVRPIGIDTEQELLAALGAPQPGTRAIALVGGADNLSQESRAPVAAFFQTLAMALDRSHGVLVDGGTDSGIMQLVAEARRAAGVSFRLVGVAPHGRIGKATRTGAIVELAKGHPEILLVPGTSFGDETPWLFRAADHLAGGRAATLVVNGGRLTLGEAIRRLAAGAPVIAVTGSGRAADVLARAVAAGGTLGAVPSDAADDEFRPFPLGSIDTRYLRLVGLDVTVDDLVGALDALVQKGMGT